MFSGFKPVLIKFTVGIISRSHATLKSEYYFFKFVLQAELSHSTASINIFTLQLEGQRYMVKTMCFAQEAKLTHNLPI